MCSTIDSGEKGYKLLEQILFNFLVKFPTLFQDQLSLNAGQKYCRMLLEQYFRPSTNLFCLFLRGRLTQVLLYHNFRVGSHVVSVRIHCTEKWRTSFHTDVLSKSK